MKNFNFINPVRIVFGKDTIKDISELIPPNSKVLVTYGGGSIKKNGVYDQVKHALVDFEWEEFGGIEPNPHYETCLNAVKLIKDKQLDYVLAVGGGSVIDATKFIVAASKFEGKDPWDILAKQATITDALPFGAILTLSATGSEMNGGAVITKASTQEKLAFSSPLTYPSFSILDPETTYSLPEKQVANGVIDSFVHVIEQYITYSTDSLIQDKFSEAILSTLVIEGQKALKDPLNYDVRANLMWASTWALNGWIGVGVPQDWATHMIGHELTAFCGIDHAVTLAIVLPGVLEVMREQKADKIAQMGTKVFELSSTLSKDELIDKTIADIEKFFNDLGVKTHLSDYNVSQDVIDKIVDRFRTRGWKLGEKHNIDAEVVKKILELRK